jgi:FkbM family methyltransferase
MNLREEEILSTNNIYNVPLKCFNDYIYKNSVLINRIWDENIVNEIIENIPENTDILDIGANIGLISIGTASKTKKVRYIHAFECDSKIIPLLSFNISKFENILMYPFALSNKTELCKLTSLKENMGCNYIYSSNDSETKEYDYFNLFDTESNIRIDNRLILATNLDNIIYQFTHKIGLIKIDVVGYELKVLEGAKELIKLHKPIIIVEIFKNNLEEIFKLLGVLGYIYCRRIPNDLYQSQDYIFFPV